MKKCKDCGMPQEITCAAGICGPCHMAYSDGKCFEKHGLPWWAYIAYAISFLVMKASLWSYDDHHPWKERPMTYRRWIHGATGLLLNYSIATWVLVVWLAVAWGLFFHLRRHA